ncbi:MAG: cation diffusion facilitator family transporter [Clostridiales bacterium]|nr:cation diffusion facilitator family transporter [Clostridiales bacterium]
MMGGIKTKSKKSAAVCVLGICLNLALFFIKLYIGLSTGSLCIYTDAVNSALDSVTCIIAVIGFCILGLRANEKYPCGYGRAEDMVSFIMSAVITATGCYFAYYSAERIMYPTPVWYSVKYALLVGLTAGVKLGMAVFYRAFQKKYPSPVIKDMALDSIMDFFISLTAVISFTLSDRIGYSVDGFAGLAISIAVIAEGFKILSSSCKKLMGKRDDEICGKAEEFLLSRPEIVSVKRIINHSYGSFSVIDAEVVFSSKYAENAVTATSVIKQDFLSLESGELIISIGGFSDE